MGQLVDGKWQDTWYDTKSTKGKFVRTNAQFRHWITAGGAPGPSGEGGYAAEANRYHLYVSYACPWAHRTLIMRGLKGLEAFITVSIVHWRMREHGWTFEPGEGVVEDAVNQKKKLYEIYTLAKSDYSGRVTVPVLWDKKNQTMVSNESSEIIRMFNSAFDDLGAAAGDYYPEELREQIDAINERVYKTVNNGVYRAGFATEQGPYEEAFEELFDSLEWLEDILSRNQYLLGERLTEADIRLLTTLLRFDPVYYGHFKTNKKHLYEYENLWRYTRSLYQLPAVKQTTNFDHIKRHYYESQITINPTGIYPRGPEIDFSI